MSPCFARVCAPLFFFKLKLFLYFLWRKWTDERIWPSARLARCQHRCARVRDARPPNLNEILISFFFNYWFFFLKKNFFITFFLKIVFIFFYYCFFQIKIVFFFTFFQKKFFYFIFLKWFLF